MKLIYSIAIFLFSFFAAFAQNTITIQGKLLKNKTELPIESATVYLIRAKDSSIVDYTISDKNGLFKLATKKNSEESILKISADAFVDFSQKMEKVNATKDLGTLYLKERINMLKEVVINANVPPIRIKKDTLEFNTAAFKLRPDANVEALLRQLPGVDIDADKKIRVNGKEVNQVLVNGKPFFGEDGKVALQNLPAEIIKKVQVSDTKTKEQEFTKQVSSSNNSSINLTIEKDKNKGFFGKVLGGYGSSERYESSALLSYFKDKRRISFLASSNNINATGFSMDDVFDTMGGGRNAGSRGPKIGGGTGITQSNMVGLNYTDEWFKGAKSTGNYSFTNSNTENENRTTETTLLPIGSLLSESSSTTNREFSKHTADFNLEYDISPNTKIIIVPKLDKGTTKSITDFDKITTNDKNELVNSSNSFNINETENTNFQNNISFFTKSKKAGRYFIANFNNENIKNNSNTDLNSATLFAQGTDSDDIRNQNIKSQTTRDKYSSSISYIEPVTDSLSLNISLYSELFKIDDDRKAFDQNTLNVDLIDSQSNNFFLSRFQISPSAGFIINKKKFTLRALTSTYFVSSTNQSIYLNKKNSLDRNFVIPGGNLQMSYRFTKSKGIAFFYDRKFLIPREYQLLAVENLENPLITKTGNPNLKASTSHDFNLTFTDYDYVSRSGYYIYSKTSYDDNQIVSASTYNNAGRQISSYDNVYGTYNTTLGSEWNKTIKKKTNTFSFNFGLSTNYSLDKGFTNGLLYSAKTFRVLPVIKLSYEYGKLFIIKPSYNFVYTITKYKNSFIKERTNKLQNFNLEMTNFIQKHWVIGNDFGYSYNSNISGAFKKDFYLWNTSVSYKFLKDKMNFKIKVYDLLNQNQSNSRSITSTAIIDSENTVLKRYVMFSLLYKFQNFAVKKKN